MTEKVGPIATLADRTCLDVGGSPFERYRKHVEPLGIILGKDVLIIGPGAAFEEIALIEPEIAEGRVKNLQLIGCNSLISMVVKPMLKDLYDLEIETSGIGWGPFFQYDPERKFDTIFFFGTPFQYPNNDLPEIAKQLNKGGKFYATINTNRVPESLDKIEGCVITVIPEIPSNPNYHITGIYYGLVLERQT